MPVNRAHLPLSGLVVLALAACSGGAAPSSAPTTARPRPTTTTAAPTTTTTVAPTTTTPPPAEGLAQGAKGPEVEKLQRRLVELRYDPGAVDGTYGAGTFHAVMAFQKVHGLGRTGKATPDVLAALATAGPPAPLVPAGGPDRVEVDMGRQVLFLYKGGALDRILSASTGTGKRYCENGTCGVAVTPVGSFRVYKRIPGWRKSTLGLLYNPLYVRGGVAIHGARSVPAHPASHGCVRIPMHSAEWMPGAVPNGTPVYVVGNGKPVEPLADPAPTTTTAPPTTAPPDTAPTTTAPPETTTTSSTTSSTLPTDSTVPVP